MAKYISDQLARGVGLKAAVTKAKNSYQQNLHKDLYKELHSLKNSPRGK